MNNRTMYYFTSRWYNTFTLHVPSFVTAEFLLFIKSKLKMFYT